MRLQMVKRSSTFISIFAGCGGSSLGYRWAGFKELLAVDIGKSAAEAFKLNFPDTPCWQEDIKGVSGKKILDFCGIQKGELDLLDASPPCQGFSSVAGKRKVNDLRNDLFMELVRLAKELGPKVFVMENVPGLIGGRMKGKFIEIMRELKALPYQVKCKLMNSMYYGVPQSRRRLIWIGVRNDLGKNPTFPAPSRRKVSSKEALSGLPEDRSRTLSDFAIEIWGRCRNGELFRRHHPKGHWFSSRRMNPHKPSATITGLVMPRGGKAGLFHWAYPRVLNIAELKRLSTFPDDFELVGNFEDQWGQIGNAVMPRFMEAIARHVRETVLND